MMFLSNINGLSQIYYPNSNFLKSINFDNLKNKSREKRYIYHNAWNLDDQKLELFANDVPPSGRVYPPITDASLCACSALPFVESTVEIGPTSYCEGALVDTVNFRSLLEDHFDAHTNSFDLDEIWISRIVDSTQIHRPKNLHDALANLCELFAATVGEDDVKLFKYHVKDGIEINGKKVKWKGTIVEIQVNPYVDFKWTHSNLELGMKRGRDAAEKAFRAYEDYKNKRKGAKNHEVVILNEREKAEGKERRRRYPGG
jgi:predicted acylesterase/phospholipase RssA